MFAVQVAVVVFALAGSIIDTAVAISSGMYEVYRHEQNSARENFLIQELT